MRRRYLSVLSSLFFIFAIACGGDNDDDTSNQGGGTDAGDVADSDTTNDGGDGGDTDDSGNNDLECPTDDLPDETSFTYEGSTIGNDNLFESTRLEWDDAGDDALLWEVPEEGTYQFSMSDDVSESNVCGISIRNGADGAFHTPDLCPDDDEPVDLPDAHFIAGEDLEGEAELSSGQELLVLVGCQMWADPAENDYSITIEKL